MIVPRAIAILFLAALAAASTFQSKLEMKTHLEPVLMQFHNKLKARAKELAAQGTDHPRLAKTNPLAAQEHLQATASSSQFSINYIYSEKSCPADSAVFAVVTAMDVCIPLFGDYFIKSSCSGNQINGGLYEGDCTDDNLVESDKFKGLGKCMSAANEDDEYDDDIFENSYEAVVCSDTIGYDLAEEPAEAYYLDDNCAAATRYIAFYYKPTECTSLGGSSISAECGDDLLVNLYDDEECTDLNWEYADFEVDVCEDLGGESVYASCDASTLPGAGPENGDDPTIKDSASSLSIVFSSILMLLACAKLWA